MPDVPQINGCRNRLAEDVHGEDDGCRTADLPNLPFETPKRPRYDLDVFALREMLYGAQISRQPQRMLDLPQLVNHSTRLRDGNRPHDIPGSENLRPLLQ